jgi:hypothetical protein
VKPADTDTNFALGGDSAKERLQCCNLAVDVLLDWRMRVCVKLRLHVEEIDNVGLTVPADSQAFCHFSLLVPLLRGRQWFFKDPLGFPPFAC